MVSTTFLPQVNRDNKFIKDTKHSRLPRSLLLPCSNPSPHFQSLMGPSASMIRNSGSSSNKDNRSHKHHGNSCEASQAGYSATSNSQYYSQATYMDGNSDMYYTRELQLEPQEQHQTRSDAKWTCVGCSFPRVYTTSHAGSWLARELTSLAQHSAFVCLATSLIC